MNGHYEIKKVVLWGPSEWGKSALLEQLTTNYFNEDSDLTIGIDFGSKIYSVQDKSVKLQIWDTAGSKDYLSISCCYLNGPFPDAVIKQHLFCKFQNSSLPSGFSY